MTTQTSNFGMRLKHSNQPTLKDKAMYLAYLNEEIIGTQEFGYSRICRILTRCSILKSIWERQDPNVQGYFLQLEAWQEYDWAGLNWI